MKVKHSLSVVAAAVSLVAGSALAAPITLTNLDGSFVNFTDFDWSSSGQAYVSGYDILSTSPTGTVDIFRLQYQADASALKVGGFALPAASTPGLGTTYEYTIYVDLQETATCLTVGVATCDTALLSLQSGTWSVYYDTTPGTFADYSAGTGFMDGTLLLSGTFNSSTPVFAPQGPSNPGAASLAPSLFGTVLTTNLTYVDPSLTGTTATSTLQFCPPSLAPGAEGCTQTTGWVPPTFFNGVAVADPQTNTNFYAQADANQSFRAAVPEPGSIALLGLGLGIMGAFSRRRKQV